jgi:hypothetical protein
VYNKKIEPVEISSKCSEHIPFHFPEGRFFTVSGNKKKLLKCDINGLQEAFVISQKVFYFKVIGRIRRPSEHQLKY